MFSRYKMTKILKKFLLAGDKCMPEMYLKQLRFTCSAYRLITKNKEKIQKFTETEHSRYIY